MVPRSTFGAGLGRRREEIRKGVAMRSYAVVVLAGLLGLLVPGLAAGMSDSQRIKLFEDAMRRQQEEIRQLRQELQQQRADGQGTQTQAEQADQKGRTMQKKDPGDAAR